MTLSEKIKRQVERAVADIRSRPPALRGPFQMKQKYTIDWRIEGTFEVKAESPTDAINKFDKAWGAPSGIMPMRDGQISNDEPVEAAE